jgi:hypothetical protein
MSDLTLRKREMLTDSDVEFLAQLMQSVAAQGNGPEFERNASLLFRVASDMLALTADLNEAEVQVPWSSVCWAAHLPQTLTELERTKDALAKILGPLGIDLSEPPENSRWRAKYPTLKAFNKDSEEPRKTV